MHEIFCIHCVSPPGVMARQGQGNPQQGLGAVLAVGGLLGALPAATQSSHKPSDSLLNESTAGEITRPHHARSPPSTAATPASRRCSH